MTTIATTTAAIDDLVEAAHELAALGLSPGTSGNVSVRFGDRVYLSATGASMATLTPAGLSELALDGTHLAGPRPTKEAPLHLAFYRKSDRTRAVVHLHSAAAVAASCLPPHSDLSALPPITPYFVMRVGQTPLIPYAAPGSSELANQIELRTFEFRAALLQNHGSIVAADSVARAVDAAIELEAAAEVLMRLGSQEFTPLTDAQARELADRYDSCWDGDGGEAGGGSAGGGSAGNGAEGGGGVGSAGSAGE
ncbi:class II aldolase/adducin family protein [Agromyces aerolatus]|uniref:class II aldolase/adducin family protein n=1 Tax=Agromyces sp. LY-1074 TaxID=3074080 RepID=UPI00285EEC41|nr:MULTISPECIES: class II aldolase/adducin family protein [unclassified Agromyces]MDR5699388.1 class II aldolase/adducin family protein [Agromyces sp. LY-1074]MDR5705684.1 class II aldolase/adducin family protein [Agromyces sp. LY-1358]